MRTRTAMLALVMLLAACGANDTAGPATGVTRATDPTSAPPDSSLPTGTLSESPSVDELAAAIGCEPIESSVDEPLAYIMKHAVCMTLDVNSNVWFDIYIFEPANASKAEGAITEMSCMSGMVSSVEYLAADRWIVAVSVIPEMMSTVDDATASLRAIQPSLAGGELRSKRCTNYDPANSFPDEDPTGTGPETTSATAPGETPDLAIEVAEHMGCTVVMMDGSENGMPNTSGMVLCTYDDQMITVVQFDDAAQQGQFLTWMSALSCGDPAAVAAIVVVSDRSAVIVDDPTMADSIQQKVGGEIELVECA